MEMNKTDVKMSIEEATSYAVAAIHEAGIDRETALKVVGLMCDHSLLRNPKQAMDLALTLMSPENEKRFWIAR